MIEPVFLATSSDMRKMDEDCVKRQNISFAELMERAATSAFDCIIKNKFYNPDKKIIILCGAGNNGGDGYVLALLFAKDGADVCVINLFGEPAKSQAALYYYNKLAGLDGVKILNSADLSDEKLQNLLFCSDIIIDAIFGTGFKGELSGEALRVLKFANRIKNIKIAVDVPSGVNCDDGTAGQNSFNADLTVTFEFIKRGLVSYPAAGFTGKIEVVSIGFEKETRNLILENPKKSILLSFDYVKNLFDSKNKRKSKNTNKGDFGKLLAVCGSENMTGAAYFAAMGALRAGVGLLYLATEKEALKILQTKLNEPVFAPVNFDNPDEIIKNLNNINANAILIGPGLGVENSRKIINLLFVGAIPCGCPNQIQTPLQVQIQTPPQTQIQKIPRTIIFDADGINALCGNINILNQINGEKILTPHPGEMMRLCKAAELYTIETPQDIQDNRINIASNFAQKYNCTLVLKGANTIIACKNGDIYINPTGNPGMSKGGTGDILAGMTASYCAQGIEPEDSACIAVYLHGLAGDIAAERYSETGMLPSDMLNIIAEIQK